jgi:rRNA maturation protein Nop10
MSVLPRDVEEFLNDLAARLPLVGCPVCGSKVVLVNWPLSCPSLKGKIWTLPLPVCPECGLDDTADFVPSPLC